MSEASEAWAVVQLAELVRTCEELLLRVLDRLDVDVRAAMPEDAGWVLSGEDVEQLRVLLVEHGEIAERLAMCVERLPSDGVVAAYADVREGAAARLAEGILDAAGVVLAASALDVPVGWVALAEALERTDVRGAWDKLGVGALLGSFRRADPGLVSQTLLAAGVEDAVVWPELSAEATRRLAVALRAGAGAS